jgi:hypothetical protein
MEGIADFLIRLRELNPAVNLSTFRLDAGSEAHMAPSEEPGEANKHGITVALFPLSVIVILALLAMQTLAGR